jgi:hypothetical protein
LKRALGLVSLLLALGGAVSARAQSSFFYIIPDTISFGTVSVGQSVSRSVSTYRSADDGTVVTATSSHLAFTVSPSSQVVGTDGAQFTVRFQPTAGGNYTGVITFSTQSGGTTRVLGEVAVDGTGFAPFTVDPATLTFDPLLVGSSSTKTFRIVVSQSGGLDLTLRSSSPAFSVSPSEFSGLGSGQAGVATVTFTPNAAGTLRGAITVVGGGATVPVVVEGEGAAFLLSPTQINLGGTLVGCASMGVFTVTTGGPFDFSVVPTTAGLPFSVEPAAFSTAGPTAVTASFRPTGPGAAQGIFRIFARTGSRIVQQQDLPVSGDAVEPVPDPALINFGDVAAGTTSPPRSTIIMANPPGSFQGAYSASSNNPAFRVISTNTSGRVEVVYAPGSEGPANGIITVQVASQSDRSCGVPVEIAVQGVGTPAPLTLSPSSLDFGMVAIGQTSLAREILVSNQSATSFTGTVSVDNAAFRLNPVSSAVVAQTVLTVPAGGSARVPVVFQPPSQGVATATLTFDLRGTPVGSSEAVNLIRTVGARGEGIAANLSYMVVQGGAPAGVSPGGTVRFGPTGVGATSSVEFEVRNEGSNPATIDAVTVSDAPIFSAGLPALPATVAPGAALTFTLNFQPSALAPFSGTLDVGFASFALDGSGVLGGAQITGVADSVPANTQPQVGVVLSQPAPRNLTGTLMMAYTPAGSLRPDPTAQFATGGTSASFTVAEGATAAVFPGGQSMIGFQSGTVAANFVFSASLEAGETDVTPAPEPTRTVSIAGGPPTISGVTVELVTASGFTVVVQGFSPTREITQAVFTFTGRSGIQVQPASVTPGGIGDAFRNWYQSEASAAFGSMFTLTVPFTITGETNAIASVSATVSNAQGASTAVSANLP